MGVRIIFGLRKQRQPIPGHELAGKIEAIGSKNALSKNGLFRIIPTGMREFVSLMDTTRNTRII